MSPPTHNTPPRARGLGHPGDTDTGGWLGVISAGRARWSKRGRGELARGGVKKKKKDFRKKRNGPRRRTDCPFARPRCPAVRPPPPSEIHTKWRRGPEEPRDRERRKGEVGGGTGRRRPRHGEERFFFSQTALPKGSGKSRMERMSPREGRKKPRGAEPETSGRRKEPKAVVGT